MSFMAFAVLLLALPAGAREWSALSVRAEEERISELGIAFPDAGNAAEAYLPYLRGEAKITAEPWFHEIVLALVDSPVAGDRDKLARGAEQAGPDIDAVATGSRRAECRVWGVYYQPDAGRTLFSQDTPAYVMLFRIGVLMIAHADRLGHASDASELYLAVIRLGHHLEHQPDLFAYVAGLALKEKAASRLADLPGPPCPERDRFRSYAAVASDRISVKNRIIRSLPEWDRDQIEVLVLDPDAPYALRLDTLTARHYCLHDNPMLVRCALLGTPRWVRALEDKFARQDELSRRFVEVMQAHRAELKWLR